MKIIFLVIFCVGLSACGKGFESLRNPSSTGQESNRSDNQNQSDQVSNDNNFEDNEPQFLTSEEAFAQSLHPLVKFRCGNCHATQSPRFAVVDVASAHNTTTQTNNLVNFVNAASSDMVREIAGGHNGINTSVARELELAILRWKDQSGQ